MNKIFLILLTLILYFGTKSSTVYRDYQLEIVTDIVKSCNVLNEAEKINKTMVYAKKYSHDPIILSRLIRAESAYIQYRYNSKSGAIGLLQIMTNIHKIDDAFNIDTNMNYGAKLLRQYLSIDGTYKTALLKYGGWMCDRWEHRSNEAREYLNKVLGNDLK